MRPVRLTMQAFGPYPDREIIDFRDAVEAGLFGIYGPTGSGKSTIFSAMTFALFGEPAKTEQDAPSLRSDHAEAGVQTEVEFVFDLGEHRFVVWRQPDQMRPKQRGEGETRSPHEAFLFDATGLVLEDIKGSQRGRIIAEKKVRDVDTAISQMLGYGPEQFRQIVLLPQGRFETFLSAKTRERVEILRELFDVSLYRTLAEKLKIDSEIAERAVRDERKVCAGRLAAEGFESTDALSAGIAEAETLHTEMLENEKEARSALGAVQDALTAAEKVEAQFNAAKDARKSLAGLQAEKNEIDALADRVARAEKALSLLDVEANVMRATDEVGEAEENLQEAREAAEAARKKAGSAAQTLQKEIDRAGETEELRRQVEELDRHEKVLEKSTDVTEALDKAQAAEREAAGKRDETKQRLTGLQEKQRKKNNALKAARTTEAVRHEMLISLTAFEASFKKAVTFEKAENDILTIKAEAGELTSAHGTAAGQTKQARVRFEEAERNLASVQALHLASGLVPGVPCPVCGASDHPAPATGKAEHAGRDQEFRDAKATWEQAEAAARSVAGKLTKAETILRERQDQLVSLDPPEDSVAVLKERIDAGQQALDGLDPETDFAEAEA